MTKYTLGEIVERRFQWFHAAKLYPYAIIRDGKLQGKVALKIGEGTVTAICETTDAQHKRLMFTSRVRGYGFDRETAAMGGWTIDGFTLIDQGKRWIRQLEDAGFIVVHMQ